jgi:outer membrane protein
MMRSCVVACLVALAASVSADAQGPASPDEAPQTFTLEEAMRYAADHYPAVRAAVARVNASAATVRVAETAYLPRLDSVWQTNRATANNLFGQLLPQSVIPSLSGPVLPSAVSDTAWSSAVGALASWEPFDFGLRGAEVDEAEAGVARARADQTLARLDVQSAVGAAFLDLLAAQTGLAAARANLERRDVLQRSVQTLVDNQLRPGADASRAHAEHAAAATRVIEAERDVTLAQLTFARLLGLPPAPGIAAIGDALLANEPPAAGPASPAQPAAHPLAQAQQARLAETRAAEQTLARTDLPRVFVQGSVSARGSGANAIGPFDGGAGGLGLERANWAAGVQIVFPNVFDFSSLHARKAAAAADSQLEAARYDETLLTIVGEQQAALARLQAARLVAANTPVQLTAARESESQARARYDAGLAALADVADAESLLAQAEVEDQLARVGVWRALLATAVAQGDLEPFMSLLHQPQ